MNKFMKSILNLYNKSREKGKPNEAKNKLNALYGLSGPDFTRFIYSDTDSVKSREVKELND